MTASTITSLARELGLGLIGVTDARPSDYADHVRRWIASDKHGEMHYLANNLEVRLDPGRLLDGARSVIAVADAYATEGLRGQGTKRSSDGDLAPGPLGPLAPSGRIARYAWGDDYHKVLKKRLHRLADALQERFPDEQFRCVVDTAPALEREHAVRAGLGWVGKNTMLIHPRYGSYLMLGLIVSTVASCELRVASSPEVQNSKLETRNPKLQTDHCGTCTRCIDACPTQCIESDREKLLPAPPESAPGEPALASGSSYQRSIDATRCISYLTLEHRSLIDPALHESMGDWIAGCDVCQEVCPYNRMADGGLRMADGLDWPSPSAIRHPKSAIALPIHPRYAPRPELAAGLPLLDILDWTVEDRQTAFQGSALKRIKLDMLRRNALIALGNHLARRGDGHGEFSRHDDSHIRTRIEHIAADPDEPDLVRDTAKHVLDRLLA